MQYYVSAQAGRGGDGSKAQPFRWISQAAEIARPGDEVIVAPGIYPSMSIRDMAAQRRPGSCTVPRFRLALSSPAQRL